MKANQQPWTLHWQRVKFQLDRIGARNDGDDYERIFTGRKGQTQRWHKGRQTNNTALWRSARQIFILDHKSEGYFGRKGRIRHIGIGVIPCSWECRRHEESYKRVLCYTSWTGRLAFGGCGETQWVTSNEVGHTAWNIRVEINLAQSSGPFSDSAEEIHHPENGWIVNRIGTRRREIEEHEPLTDVCTLKTLFFE